MSSFFASPIPNSVTPRQIFVRCSGRENKSLTFEAMASNWHHLAPMNDWARDDMREIGHKQRVGLKQRSGGPRSP